MTALVAPFSPTDTRSAIADWMELQALGSSRGRATYATLANVLDIAEDEAAAPPPVDEETGDLLDDAILEGERYSVITAAFDELEYRQRVLGTAYPFVIDTRALIFHLSSDIATSQPGQIVYLFCLLASAIRERKLQPAESVVAAESGIANVFQICACLAAGGYIHGEVASFGFPRATGLDFLPALRDAFERFGVGRVRTEIPEGLPEKLKDGGIDVIAWRNHPDGMPGKTYLLGQCASGQGWGEKSVVEYVPQLHGSWFTEIPAQFWLPAMFIPFTFHRDILEARQVQFLDKVRTAYWHHEQRYGIIFDRLRIAYFADQCMAEAEDPTEGIDGRERFNEVRTWLGEALRLAGLGAVA